MWNLDFDFDYLCAWVKINNPLPPIKITPQTNQDHMLSSMSS